MTPLTRDHKYVRLALLLRSMPHFSYVDLVLGIFLLQIQITFPSRSIGISLGGDYWLRVWYNEYKWVRFYLVLFATSIHYLYPLFYMRSLDQILGSSQHHPGH